MSKNLPCITVEDSSINGLRDYFFNNYRGEEFSTILKGRFYIKVIDDITGESSKFFVEQNEEDTVISLVVNSSISFLKVRVIGNTFIYNNEEGAYETKTSIEINSLQLVPKDQLLNFEKQAPDIFCYVVTFFSNEEKAIPFEIKYFTNLKKKSKQKKLVKEYSISKKIVTRKVKPEFADNITSINQLNELFEIKTSIFYYDELKRIMKEQKSSFDEPLFIPFSEFLLSLDNEVTKIYCKVNEDKKRLEAIVFKNGFHMFALMINLEGNTSRNFKIFTYDEFNSIENEHEYTPVTIAKNIINLMSLNFFYFTHYKIIQNPVIKKSNRKQVAKKDEKDPVSISVKEVKTALPKVKNIYMGKKRVYDISASITKKVDKRKKAEFKKFSWQVRGHIRRLKSGKEIYIKPYTCKRQKSQDDINQNDKKNYIIKL